MNLGPDSFALEPLPPHWCELWLASILAVSFLTLFAGLVARFGLRQSTAARCFFLQCVVVVGLLLPIGILLADRFQLRRPIVSDQSETVPLSTSPLPQTWEGNSEASNRRSDSQAFSSKEPVSKNQESTPSEYPAMENLNIEHVATMYWPIPTFIG